MSNVTRTTRHPKRKSFPCQFPGCHRAGNGKVMRWCKVHPGGIEHKCCRLGCENEIDGMSNPVGYCWQHNPEREFLIFRSQISKNRVYEEGFRLVRDRRLREKMLPTVSAEQEDVCMGFWDSTGVENGEAINLCPWSKRKVHKAAQQLDHIIRVADGGSDERENLQMLCACCHALKTAAESGSASIGNVVE